jgi:hypothetical protein
MSGREYSLSLFSEARQAKDGPTAEKLTAHARPEFPHDVETCIEADLLTPFVDGLPKASVSSPVEV